MITTSPQGERLCRQLAALLADPASWVGGVVPREALPYLGAAPPGLPDAARDPPRSSRQPADRSRDDQEAA